MAMTRRRFVTPEGFSREELLSLPPAMRLTEIGLRLYADDHGREKVNQRLMLARLYPLDEAMTEQDIDEHLIELDEAGAIVLYAGPDGSTFYAVTEWPTVDRPGRSKFPAPPDEDSRTDREAFANGSWRGSVREGERESEREWESERGHARPDREGLPPSPFCKAHEATGGIDDPCRACGRARLQRKVFDDRLAAEARGVRFEPEQ